MGRHNHRHSKTRASRPLIVVLGATMAVGGGTYYHFHKKAHIAGAAHDAISLKAVETQGPATPSPVRPAPAAPAPLVTATPTTLPTTAPARIASAPTTKPVEAKAPVTAPPAHESAVLASAVLSPQPLAEAKHLIEANQLLDGREVLNNALASGRLNAQDTESARKWLSDINQTIFFSKTKFKDDPWQTLYQVQPGERLARIADKHAVTWELLCRVNGMADARKLRSGQWIKIPKGPFHCVITKSAYRLDLYLGSPGESGSLFVTTFPVGLGKDNSTPTGMWIVQSGNKAHPATYYSPRGEGVIAADDPKNPLGGYWMGLTGLSGNALEKNSYGIHGTIEPDSIGKQASMGCIRLRHDDIAFLYDLLVEGKSKVVVKD